MHELLKKLNESRRKNRNLNIVLAVLAVLVVGGVLWKLTLPGIAKSADRVYCGEEEHTHTEECEASSNLICGMEETEGHTHSEDCYTERTELICELPEDENHTHEDSCYETSYELTCGQEETEGHVHDDSCYEVTNACSLEEHVHTLECYSDITADLEDEGTWENTFRNVELGDNWGSNAVAIAETQLGYQESNLNYEVAEDGTTLKGYTRYGAWANAKYIDWDSAFASFVLYYAQVPDDIFPTMPDNMDTVNWMSRLSEWNLLGGTDTQPQAGDLVFFERAENSGIKTRVGIISAAEENEAEGITYIHVIEGDYCTGDVDIVKENRYACTDSSILGYGLLSVAEKEYKGLTDDEVAETEAADAEPTEAAEAEPTKTGEATEAAEAEVTETPEATEAPEATKEAEATEATPTETPEAGEEQEEKVGPIRRIMKALTKGNDSEAAAVNSARSNEVLPVTAVSGSGTAYDKTTGNYTTDLKINFKLEPDELDCNKDYYFKYPEEVLVPAGLIGGPKDLYDDEGVLAGTYTFVKNPDGTSSVKVNFNKDYTDKAEKAITGHVTFSGTLVTQSNDDGHIKINFGNDNLDLDVPPEDITYPDNETDKYDLSVKKSGEYKKEENKLTYTVYVCSTKGTPDTIDFNDVITANGFELGTPTVTVEQGTYTDRVSWNEYGQSWSTVSVQHNYQDGKISMDLPKLEGGGEKDGCKTGNCYKITYTYDLGSQELSQVLATNKAYAESKDNNSGKIVKNEIDHKVDKDYRYSLSKNGWKDNGKIHWEITVNNNQIDITDAVLTDKMFAEIAKGKEVQISPSEGVDVQRDSKGNITSIKFVKINGEPNTKRYTINYFTEIPENWEASKLYNEAKLDPVSGKPVGAGVGVDIPAAGSVDKNYSEMKPSDDGKTGEVTWHVTIDVPASGLPKGIVIEDTIPAEWNGAVTNQWMTRDQITKWALQLVWGNNAGSINPYVPPEKDVTFWASDGKWYSFEQISHSEGDTGTLKYTKFRIEFPDGLIPPGGMDNKLTFTYKTIIDLEKANQSTGSTKFSNTVKVGDKWKEASYDYYKDNVVKTDGNDQTNTTNFTSEEGKLTWKVKVSITEGHECKKLTVKDSLPKGVTLDKISLSDGTVMDLAIADDGTVTGSNNDYLISGSYNNETGEIHLDMTRKDLNTSIKSNAQYVFTFNCHADSDKLGKFELGKVYTFKNSVNVELDDMHFGSSDQTQKWTYDKPVEEKKKLEKSGHWDNDARRLNYSITVNPEGKDLIEGSDKLTLTDNLYYCSIVNIHGQGYQANVEAVLIQNSVKLYKAVPAEGGGLTKGEEIKGWKWTYDSSKNDDNGSVTNTIIVNDIPDSTPLIFEYAYKVDSNAQKGDSFSLGASNTASLDGVANSSTQNNNREDWKDQQSSAGVDTEKGYVFYKVDNDDYNIVLPGAEFTVYACNKDGECDRANPIKTYTTNEAGKFQIQWEYKKSDDSVETPFKHNVLYKVEETKVPEGYELPDTVPEYYFYFFDASKENQLPDKLPTSAVDLSKSGHTVYAKNVLEKDYTYTFTKVEAGKTENHLAGAEFSVYRYDTEQDQYDEGIVRIYKSGEDGTFQIHLKDEKGNQLYDYNTLYKIRETKAPSGYQISDTVPEYYFYFSRKNDTLRTLPAPEKIPSNAVDLSKHEFSTQVENEKAKTYTFVKVDAENEQKYLEGAEFTVYECYSNGTIYAAADVPPYVTDKDGKFQIQLQDENGNQLYKYNTLYKVVETKAPKNYLLPNPAPEYDFYFSKDKLNPWNQWDLPGEAVDLSRTDGAMQTVKNKRTTTDITVNKIWENHKGEQLHPTEGSVQLQLYKHFSYLPTGEDSNTAGSAKLTGEVKTGHLVNGNFFKGFDSMYSVGTKLTFRVAHKWSQSDAPILTFNGKILEYESYVKEEEVQLDQHNKGPLLTWTYSITIQTGENKLSGYLPNWNSSNWEWSDFEVEEPSPLPEDEAVGDPFTLSAPGWSQYFGDLPLSEEKNGKTYYYTYYVKEITEDTNYEVKYDNNGGITSGVIKVTNKDKREPSYLLPETGGSGTTPYTAAGLGIMLTAGVMYTIKSRKGGRRFFRN